MDCANLFVRASELSANLNPTSTPKIFSKDCVCAHTAAAAKLTERSVRNNEGGFRPLATSHALIKFITAPVAVRPRQQNIESIASRIDKSVIIW